GAGGGESDGARGGGGDAALPVLRLSQGPGDLPVSALVQIICTFAQAEELGDGDSASVVGPAVARVSGTVRAAVAATTAGGRVRPAHRRRPRGPARPA